jgi:phage recombination protein Bet
MRHWNKPAEHFIGLWQSWKDEILPRWRAKPEDDSAEGAAATGVEPGPLPLGSNFSDDLDLLHRVSYGHLSEDQFRWFLNQCRERGMNPFAEPLHVEWQDGVDGGDPQLRIVTPAAHFRAIARRTGRFKGVTQAMYCGPDGAWREVWAGDEPPHACKVGVRVSDDPEPITHVALWKEHARYLPRADGEAGLRPAEFWGKMPCHMLAKCCEVAALRKAFGQQLDGLYAMEEMRPPDAGRPERQAGRRGPTPPRGGGRRPVPADDTIPNSAEEFDDVLAQLSASNSSSKSSGRCTTRPI